jgi:hypothetical protein
MDNDFNRRINRAIVSLSGNEALLDGLETMPAQTLLNWGITCAKNILSETQDMDDANAEAYAHPRMRALRQMLRQINMMTTARFSPDLIPATPFLDQVLAQSVIVYNNAFQPPSADERAVFLNQAITSQQEFILATRQWLESYLQL